MHPHTCLFDTAPSAAVIANRNAAWNVDYRYGMNKFEGKPDTLIEEYGEMLDTARGEVEQQRERKRGPPEANKKPATGGGVKKSYVGREEIEAVQNIGQKSINAFSSNDMKATRRFAQSYFEQIGVKSPFFRSWFGDWRMVDKTPVKIASEIGSERGVQRNDDTGWDISISGKVFNETKSHLGRKDAYAVKYLPYIRDIVKKAVLLDSFAMGERKSQNSLLMHSLYAVADIGNGQEILKLYVEEMNDPNTEKTTKRAYNLQNIERQMSGVKGSPKKVSLITQTPAIHTVADLLSHVKRKDDSFKPNFSSKVVNEDGTPKVVYHGTNTEGITVFDNESGAYWFSESEDYAEAMAEERGGDTIMKVYLNMKKPYHVLLPEGKFSDPVHEKPAIRYAEENGYDGVIFETDTDNELVYDKFYVVFKSEQIKSAVDNVGTFDKKKPDIRFSATGTEAVAALEAQNKELKEQIKVLNAEKYKLAAKLKNKQERVNYYRNKATFSPEKVGKEILTAYNSALDETEIHDEIKDLLAYAGRKSGITYQILKQKAAEVADKVVKSAEVLRESETQEDYDAIRAYHKRATAKGRYI